MWRIETLIFSHLCTMKIHLLFWVCLISLLFTGCSDSVQKAEKETPIQLVKYAEHFQIQVQGELTLIHIYSPEDHRLERTVTLQSDKKKRLAVLSSTHVGMLEKLNSISSIVGISNSLYVHNPQLLRQLKAGKVIELGEESQIPVESIIRSGCQAIVYSGFGKEFPHSKQLDKIGIDCIVNYDWRENHPLGKAEWILFFGYLIGKEAEAHAYFNQVCREYKALQAESKTFKKHPKVISGNMWGDQWNAPAGESYNAELFRDAQADYVYKNTKGTGSVFNSLEKIIQDNSETDFWFNTGMPTKKLILQAQPKLSFFGPFKKDQVYDYSRAGNRFWEMSAIEPHHVLSDYIQILHPDETEKGKLYFYQQVK